KNKINGFADLQHLCQCRGLSGTTTATPETLVHVEFGPLSLYQVSWNSPVTNKLLFEAGASAAIADWPSLRQPEVGPNDISILDQVSGLRYGAGGFSTRGYGGKYSRKTSQRFAASYVTGSHAL